MGPLAGLCACGLASVFFDLVSLLAVNIPTLLGVTRRYHPLYTWRPSTSFTFSRRYRSVFGGLIWCQEETVSRAAVKGSVFEERSDSSFESGETRAQHSRLEGTGLAPSAAARICCSQTAAAIRTFCLTGVHEPQGGGEPCTKTSGRWGAGHTSLRKLQCICHLPCFLPPLSISANIRKVQGPRLES